MRYMVDMQPTQPKLPPALLKVAQHKLFTDHVYHKAWVDFRAGIKPTADQTFFWVLLDFFRGLIQERFARKRADPVELAADEFFRLTVTGESEREGGPVVYNYLDAVSFVAAYERTCATVGRKLTDVVEETSDDGWGDFCDAVPLAGREFCEAAVAGLFTTNDLVEVALGKLGKEWYRLIRHGENYVSMRLDDEAEKRLLDFARDQLPESGKEQLN